MQGAIFDMDGLIIDSEPLWRLAEREVFGLSGVTSVSADLAVNISNGRVHGAQLRCAPQPGSVDFWGQISSSTLEVVSPTAIITGPMPESPCDVRATT